MNNKKVKWGFCLAAAIILAGSCLLAFSIWNGNRHTVGTERQFVWNASIIDTENTTADLVYHSPEKREPALSLDETWEKGSAGNFQLLSDDAYKLYYTVTDASGQSRVCMAESENGIDWVKPSLGKAEYNESNQNNILLTGKDATGGFYPFWDNRQDARENEKYKAIAVNENGMLTGYVSPDGISWNATGFLGKNIQTNLISPISLCSVFWNQASKKYVCYYAVSKADQNVLMMAQSKDFVKWSEPREIQYQKDQPLFSLQTANIQPYSRASRAIIGLPLRITPVDAQDISENFGERETDPAALTDTIFLFSEDGKRFELTQEAWLTPGPQSKDNWNFGDTFIAGGMAETPAIHADQGEDNELSFYAAENMLSRDSVCLYRYALRMDGFASYRSSFHTQTVRTKPFTLEGSRLTLNFKTSTDGYVYARILHKDGTPFEELSYTSKDGTEYGVPQYTSYKLIGDRVDREVAFNADISELVGEEIVLEFIMSDAEIFSFRFDNEPLENTSEWQPEEIEMRDYSDYSYADTPDVIEIGTQRQVLWDDYVVDTDHTDATLVSHSPVRKELMFQTDLPWEGDNCDFYVIFDDEDEAGTLYHRMYYLGWDSSAPDDIRVCYAYSYDGIEWTKPDLGLHTFTDEEGTTYTKTNIVLYNEEAMFDNFFVMKDTRPNVPDSQRYKAICQGSYDEQGYSSYGLWAWASPDGFHWTKTHRQLAQKDEWFGSFDSVNSLLWDENSQQFFTYFRVREKQLADGIEWPDFRKIYGATSKEFAPVDPDTIFTLNYGENAPLFEMYTNNISKYYRAPQLFIGFPTRFSRNNQWNKNYEYLSDPKSRREKFDAGQETRTLSMTDAMFMTSRDGYNWNRQNEAFLTPGPEYQANWIYGNCYPAYGLVETDSGYVGADRELSMYLFEGKFYHEPSSLYRYALRLDGFKSYKSSYSPQKLTTKPFTFSGSELLLNFKTSAAGSIRVSILDIDGNPLSGYESGKLIGDSTDRKISFENDLSKLNGTPIVLQFTMSDAEIYSFAFQ